MMLSRLIEKSRNCPSPVLFDSARWRWPPAVSDEETETKNRRGEATMKPLLTTSALALVAAFATTAQAQDSSSQNQQAISDQACSQSWVKVDADENGTISKAEAEKAADTEFSRIDVNGDGSVSVTEWKDCGDRTAYPGVPDALDDFPSQASASESGEGMTESPASDQAQADLEADVPETTGSISKDATSWRHDFDAADTDQSGYLTPDEAAKSEQRMHLDAASASDEADLRAGSDVFATLDSDGDGKLSTQEWSSGSKAEVGQNRGVEARYDTMDADGDGDVSRSEFKNYRGERYSAAEQTSGEVDAVPVRIFYYYVW
jgi:Ca2+-binding EF-hand superfamily protein